MPPPPTPPPPPIAPALQLALQQGAAALGLPPPKLPQTLIHHSAHALRRLLDAETPTTHPSILALVQLINLARLAILPASNDGADLGDLATRAAHIDVSTATLAALMGLKHVSSLTGAATQELSQSSSTPPVENNSNQLRMRLMPRPAQRAIDALLALVKSDEELGERVREEARVRAGLSGGRLSKSRSAPRNPLTRRRSSHAQASTSPDSQHVPPSVPRHAPPIRLPATTAGAAGSSTSHQLQIPHNNDSKPNDHQSRTDWGVPTSTGRMVEAPSQSISSQLENTPTVSSPLATSSAPASAAQNSARLREHAGPSSSSNIAPLAIEYIPPSPPPTAPGQTCPEAEEHASPEGAGSTPVTPVKESEISPEPSAQPMDIDNEPTKVGESEKPENQIQNLPMTEIPSTHPTTQQTKDNVVRAQLAFHPNQADGGQKQQILQVAANRGTSELAGAVVNKVPIDIVDRPNQVATPGRSAHGTALHRGIPNAMPQVPSSQTAAQNLIRAQPNVDAPAKLRSVLSEREKIMHRLMKRRFEELVAMPLGMSEQIRRKAIIESKQLALVELQRSIRAKVCAEMKKMFSSSVQEDKTVPADHLSRFLRRRDPPTYCYTDGYPRITIYDGVPEMPLRSPEQIAQDSQRMAAFDYTRMQQQKLHRRRSFNAKLVRHYEQFHNVGDVARGNRFKMNKGVERYFLEKRRVEEKKKKMERIERLRLLRTNDEQAYLNLLKSTKNKRLLQLVRQTDSYLMRIGAQVEKSREHPHREPEVVDSQNTFSEELKDIEEEVPVDSLRRRRDMYYTVTHAVQEEVKQPSIMVHGTLKPYQLEGLKWMISLYNNNLNGILADEMGLGKTIQTISLVTYLVEMKQNQGPFLIIVPLSTMGNWIRELDLWAPSLKKVCYRGDKNTRRAIQQREINRGDYNVLLTTYEFTVRDQNVLSRIHWQYIIIDEGHRMKNANCKLAMTLGVKYKSRNRLLLTGTPLQNNLTELWALLNFLLPTIFSSSDTFEAWFQQPFESTTLGDTAELEEEETLLIINRLHQVLRPFLLRRLKTDVESQLPQKVEHVIRCDMSSWQRVLYRQVQNRIGLATGEHSGSVKSYNNLLMQCKKICNHPYLFYNDEAILDLPPEYLIRASGKFFLLQHMLPKLKLHGHRTLIFSQMTQALDYLEDFLNAIGIQYMRLDGNTKADQRQELLNSYNAKDSPYFCFLLSTRAGGLGLNLQTADTVIIFDSDWNPMMDLQAQDRAHRIGQTKVVRVYRLICSGTVEVKILEKANQKLQVDAQIIQAGQFNQKSTETDRTQMLKDILRQKNEEDDELGVVPDQEELNRLFARTEEEFESFTNYDQERIMHNTFYPLFEKDSELPAWVLKPEEQAKTAAEKKQEIMETHGRGRRVRKPTRNVNLTDHEWLKIMEGELTMDEVMERRQKRAKRISARNEAEANRSKSRSVSRSRRGNESSEGGTEASEPDEADANEANVRASVPTNIDAENSNSQGSDEESDRSASAGEVYIGGVGQGREKRKKMSEGSGGKVSSRKRRRTSLGRAVDESSDTPDPANGEVGDHMGEVGTANGDTAIGMPEQDEENSGKVYLKLRLRPSSQEADVKAAEITANGVELNQRKSSRKRKARRSFGGEEIRIMKKRKQDEAGSPSDEVVMPEESTSAIPGNYNNEGQQPKRRKRRSNAGMRRGVNGQKKDETNSGGSRKGGKQGKIDDEPEEDKTRGKQDTQTNGQAIEDDLMYLGSDDSDSEQSGKVHEKIFLKLRLRKEGSRRRRPVQRP